MMKARSYLGLTGTLMLIGFVAAVSQADVTTEPAMLEAKLGQDIFVPLNLQVTAGETVAAISGEMNYDPALFSNPEVQVAFGAVGFIGLGNEVAPGEFRFVLYADPTRTISLEPEALFIKLTAAGVLPMDGMTTITFLNAPIDPMDPGRSSASSPEGVSLANVSFSSVPVVLNKTAATDWIRYR